MLDADRWPWVRFVGPGLITAGGLLASVGSWLNWFRVRRRIPGRAVEDFVFRGVESIDGKVTFLFAVIALVVGVLILYFSTRQSYLWLGVVALIAGVWITFFSAFDSATYRDRYVDEAAAVAAEQGVPKEQAAAFFRQWVDTGLITIKLQAGILLTVAGGAGVILGSIASALTRPGDEGEGSAEKSEEPEPLSEETQSLLEAE